MVEGPQTRRIEAQEADQRLDRWLRVAFPGLTQGRIEKLCRKGQLRVDGARAKPGLRLSSGQRVRLPPLPQQVPRASPRPCQVSKADARMIRACVLFEDAHIIVLNKPAGLPSQGGSQQPRHVDGLAAALCANGAPKPRLVHRLDKDTSGVLLLARTQQAAAGVSAALRHRATRKVYWALVVGVPEPNQGEIRYGLRKASGRSGQGAGPKGERVYCTPPQATPDSQDSKHALTRYAVVQRAASCVAWVALEPITGRTHQLRAHMEQIGHPIVGDRKYSGKYTGARRGGRALGRGAAPLGGSLSRKLHLHVRSLRLRHPITQQPLFFTAPLPKHMQHSWDMFQWKPDLALADPFG